MKIKSALLTCILAALFYAPAANASVIMTLEQSGADVVAAGSGTFDLAGLRFLGTFSNGPFVRPSRAALLEGNGDNYDLYDLISGPATFGSGPFSYASTGTGNPLAVFGMDGEIAVPSGYGSGASLSSTATWDNTTLADLGITSGTYTWTWGSGANADSLTLNIVSPVPEPAPALLLILGAAALLLAPKLSWKRKRPSPASTLK